MATPNLVSVAPSAYAKAAVRFDQYRAAGSGRAAALIAATQDFAEETAEQVELATKGVIESTRGKDSDGKACDGPLSADARKFVSYVRVIWGAVKLGRLPGFESYTNNESLVKAARSALSAQTPDGEPCDGWDARDWTGVSIAEKQAKRERNAVAKAFKEVASETFEDDGELLTISPDDFRALQVEAKARLSLDKAKKRLEKMETNAGNIADKLLKDYGPDDAEFVLKRALEILTARVIGVATA